MKGYYFALVDHLGVLCVDDLDTCNVPEWSEEQTAALADQHPDTIYFVVDNVVPNLRVPTERDGSISH